MGQQDWLWAEGEANKEKQPVETHAELLYARAVELYARAVDECGKCKCAAFNKWMTWGSTAALGGPSISRAALLSHWAPLGPMLLLLDVLEVHPNAEPLTCA